MVLVGVLLISGVLLIGVDSVGYAKGGYNSAFWRLPLDDKLDHVAKHTWEWWWISLWALFGLLLMSGGVFGLTYLLAAGENGVVAAVALGGYVTALAAWVLGTSFQAAAVSQAARERAETGETPAWLHPFWNSAYVAEGAWVIGANLAYTLIGVAILQSGLVAGWAGWVALVGGLLIVVGVLLVRDGFPQLSALVPAVIGVALLIEAV